MSIAHQKGVSTELPAAVLLRPCTPENELRLLLSTALNAHNPVEFIDGLMSDSSPTDVRHMAQYVYGLYYSIFFDVGGRSGPMCNNNGAFAQTRPINQLIDGALRNLSDSKDVIIRDWALQMRDSWNDRADMDLLSIMASRVGLHRVLPATVYYIVLAVYGMAQKDYWSGDAASVFVPAKLVSLATYEPKRLTRITSMGIPADLPRFWKWMMIMFYDTIVRGYSPYDTFMDEWSQVTQLMAAAARPISVNEFVFPYGSQSAMQMKRSSANIVASVFMAHTLLKAESSRAYTCKAIASSVMNMPYVCPDAQVADAFIRRLLSVHEEMGHTIEGEQHDNIFAYLWQVRHLFTNELPIDPDLSFEGEGASKYFKGFEDLDNDVDASSDDEVNDENGDKNIAEPTAEGETDKDIITEGETGSPMSAITLAGENEGISEYMYRSAVLRVTEDLEARPELGVSPDIVAVLKNWCVWWLWIARIEDTKTVVSELGLSQYFEPLDK